MKLLFFYNKIHAWKTESISNNKIEEEFVTEPGSRYIITFFK